jgi:hypothetical protein
MKELTQGSIVHFVSQLDGQVGMNEYAALVAIVHEKYHPEDYPPGSIEACADRHEDGDVSLHVFTENSITMRYNVPFSAEKLPNTWHWIESA